MNEENNNPTAVEDPPKEIVRDIADVVNNEDKSEPQPAPKVEREPEPSEKEKIDALIAAVDAIDDSPREQRIAGSSSSVYKEFDRTYIQRKLGIMGGLKFVRIIGKALDNAITGEDAPSLNDIIGIGSFADLSGMSGIDAFTKIITRLSMYQEDLITQIYMLALNVPVGEQPIVKEIMDSPPEDDGTGGLTYEDGTQILKVFVAQNSEELVRLFRQEAPNMVKIVQGAISKQDSSTQ